MDGPKAGGTSAESRFCTEVIRESATPSDQRSKQLPGTTNAAPKCDEFG